jgi:hypothetical protein
LGTKVNYITKKDKNNASKRITKEKIESLLKEKFT